MHKGKKKWATLGGKNKRSLDSVAVSFIRYAELAKAARIYFKATNRFDPKMDFKLFIEAEFCVGTLLHFFKVTKSFIANMQHVVVTGEKFKEEVKEFCEGLIPERSRLVTKNLEGEMAQIMQRDKTAGKGKIFQPK